MRRQIFSIGIFLIFFALVANSVALAQPVEKPIQIDFPVINVSLDGPVNLPVSQTATYSVVAKINSFASTGTTISVSLPDSITFVSANKNGRYDSKKQTLTWSLGSKGPDETITTSFKIKASTDIKNQAVINIGATLDTDQNVPISANLAAKVSAPYLIAESSISQSTVLPNETALIKLTLKNDGAETAKNVKLLTKLPAGLVASDNGLESITLDPGDIAAGKTITTGFSVRAIVGQTTGPITVITTISGDNIKLLTINTPITLLSKKTVLTPTSSGKVLGASTELTETGMSLRDWILIALASLLITAGITTLAFYPFPPRVKQ